MYCPTCGKDNSLQLKFCASCGTNLETVSQALTRGENDFFDRVNSGIDRFTESYSEHIFKKAPLPADSHPIARSWQLLMRGTATSVIDLFLFVLMCNLLPLRFAMLLISTPIKLLAERGEHKTSKDLPSEQFKAPEMQESVPRQWLAEPVPSVTEHTTTNLGMSAAVDGTSTPTTDKLIASGQ